ncbi:MULTISPECIES: asparagine synthase C-terminal domain-containing protein [Marinobacter]|uniref:asparagine synthase-related protein n=1 Tax=Marinobacter TaxID=2742 RepID=UPI0017825E02|nr:MULTISPECIES: asparagine synthase C-terminal domain-containing protein [Marinobacter]MBL3556698.1 asparagine synthase [Marinobacter sp. JB05H06]
MDVSRVYMTVNIHKGSLSGKSAEVKVSSPCLYQSTGPNPGTLYYTRLPANMSEEDVVAKIVSNDWDFVSGAEYNFLAVFVSRDGNNLTLVRDRYGSQRVLIRETTDHIIVTTDPRAVQDTQIQWNPLALRYALVSRIITEDALEDGVSVLPLLHGITYDDKNGLAVIETGAEQLRIREGGEPSSDNDLIESIKNSICESYQQINTQEPAAVLLSGGVDSFILAAIACQVFDKVKAYTPTWDKGENPELERAIGFGKKLGLEHRIVTIHPDEFKSSFFEVIDANGVPNRNYSSLVLHALFKHIPEENILYGEYADTMFGSRPVKAGIMDGKYARVLRFIPDYLIPARLKSICASIKNHGVGQLIEIPQITEPFIGKTLDSIGVSPPKNNTADRKRAFTRVSGTEFNLKTDCSQHMVEIETSALLLGKKIVTPFYNQRMVALSNRLSNRQMFGPSELSIPRNFRRDTSSHVKPLLKQLACQFIEPEAIYLEKLGFPTPFPQWIKHFVISDNEDYCKIYSESKNTEQAWSALNLMYLTNRQSAG